MSVSYAEYKKARKHGLSAREAVKNITWRKQLEADWEDVDDHIGNGHAEIERNGYGVVIDIEPDECGVDWYGTFTDKWKPGAIKNPEWRPDMAAFRSVCKWFLPMNSEADHYEGLRDLHYGRRESRDLARKYVLRDLEEAKDNNAHVLTVSVYKHAIKLGTASLGGIDLGDEGYNDPYVLAMVRDLLSDAMDEAEKAIARLCAV